MSEQLARASVQEVGLSAGKTFHGQVRILGAEGFFVHPVFVQIAWAAVMVLFASTGLTVTWIAAVVLLHPPDVTVLRYQVVCVSTPGE